MGLFGKEPVINPCEADSFEEAAMKNRARLAHERGLCAQLHDEMQEKSEKGHEGMDPAFWDGAIMANEEAFRIYQEELAAFHKRVSERVSITLLLLSPPKPSSDSWKSGWKDIGRNWANALKNNNPSVIVYW